MGKMNKEGHLELDQKLSSGIGIVSMFPDFLTKSRGQLGLSSIFPDKIGPKVGIGHPDLDLDPTQFCRDTITLEISRA